MGAVTYFSIDQESNEDVYIDFCTIWHLPFCVVIFSRNYFEYFFICGAQILRCRVILGKVRNLQLEAVGITPENVQWISKTVRQKYGSY